MKTFEVSIRVAKIKTIIVFDCDWRRMDHSWIFGSKKFGIHICEMAAVLDQLRIDSSAFNFQHVRFSFGFQRSGNV